MILDKSTRNKIFLEFSGDYNGYCLKNFQRIEQKLENAFLAEVFIFSEKFITLKNYLWNFISSIDASDVSATLISSVGGKVLKNYLKTYLESIKFENQCIKIGC